MYQPDQLLPLPSPDRIPYFFSHIFPWPILLVGGGMMWDGLARLWRSLGSYRWPTVDGRVVSVKINRADSGAEEASVDYFTAEITYAFERDGTSRTSTQLALAEMNPGFGLSPQAVMKRYPVGKSVRVFLAPMQPETSILIPGPRWPMFRAGLAGLFFLAAGATMLVAFGGLDFLKL